VPALSRPPDDGFRRVPGERVNLVGSGPIRYTYNPSLAGDDNCYSSSTPTEEVHAAAGPGTTADLDPDGSQEPDPG
jgi:hypothetical protein